MKVEFDKDGWPLEIPWPEEGEWATGVHTDGRRCCMSGWHNVAFIGDPDRVMLAGNSGEVWCALNDAARSRGYNEVIEFNDHPSTTDAMRARLWAEVWRRFGYEVEP